MPIIVMCDACGKQFRVADQFAGKSTRCKNCGQALKIPTKIEPPSTSHKLSSSASGMALSDSERPDEDDSLASMAALEPPPPGARRAPASSATRPPQPSFSMLSKPPSPAHPRLDEPDSAALDETADPIGLEGDPEAPRGPVPWYEQTITVPTARKISGALLVALIAGLVGLTFKIVAAQFAEISIPRALFDRYYTVVGLSSVWSLIAFLLVPVPCVMGVIALACKFLPGRLPDRSYLRSVGVAALPWLIIGAVSALSFDRNSGIVSLMLLAFPFVIALGVKQLMNLRWPTASAAAVGLLVALAVSAMLIKSATSKVNDGLASLVGLDEKGIAQYAKDHPEPGTDRGGVGRRRGTGEPSPASPSSPTASAVEPKSAPSPGVDTTSSTGANTTGAQASAPDDKNSNNNNPSATTDARPPVMMRDDSPLPVGEKPANTADSGLASASNPQSSRIGSDLLPAPGNSASVGGSKPTPSSEPSLADAIRAAKCDVVADAMSLPIDAWPWEIYRNPIPSKHLLVVRRVSGNRNAEGQAIPNASGAENDGEQDVVQRWSIDPPELAGRVRFRRDNGVQGQRYALSPDGTRLVCLVSWPKLGVEIYEFDKPGFPVKSIELSDRLGRANLVGFVTPERFLVRWDKGGDQGFELWDLKSGTHGKQVQLPGFRQWNAPGAFSPDAKWFATIARVKDKSKLVLTELQSLGIAARVLNLNGLDDEIGASPAGIAFSPDGKRVSAVYEHEGDALVLTWRIADGRQLEPFTLRGVLMRRRAGGGVVGDSNNARPLTFEGRVIDYIAGGRGVLLGGNTVIDPDNGNYLGQLGAESVASQWTDPNGNAYLAYAQSNNKRGIVLVKFAAEKFPNAPQMLPTNSSPTTAATRSSAGAAPPPGDSKSN